jgi:hypothetical protein
MTDIVPVGIVDRGVMSISTDSMAAAPAVVSQGEKR